MNLTRTELARLGATFVGDKAFDRRGRIVAVKADETYGMLTPEYGYKPLFRVRVET